MKVWLICVVSLFPLYAGAEVYRYVDEQGQVHFTDRGKEGAEKLPFKETPAVKPAPSPRLEPSRTKEPSQVKTLPSKSKFSGYRSLDITAPKNDETIRSNNGELKLSLVLSPELQTELNHRVDVYIDGKRAFSGASTEISVPNLDRGTHHLRAEVLDPKTGDVLAATQTITFHLKRFSALF